MADDAEKMCFTTSRPSIRGGAAPDRHMVVNPFDQERVIARACGRKKRGTQYQIRKNRRYTKATTRAIHGR